jgi:hypothetical protein
MVAAVHRAGHQVPPPGRHVFRNLGRAVRVGGRGPPLKGRGLARVGRDLGDGALSSLLRLGLDLFQSDEPLRRRVEGEPHAPELAVAQGSDFYYRFL